MNIYYEPEDFGLRKIAEFDLSDGAYQFDYVVIWQSLSTPEALYLGKDSGCSCPVPFENIGGLAAVNELERIDPANPEPQIRAAFELDGYHCAHTAATLLAEISAMTENVKRAAAREEN